ncbi:MAG: hypothetical protein AAF709_22085 [Pseudomonadota bacterium]
MENSTQLLVALSCAVGALSFFAILRRTMRSPSTHVWFANAVVAAVAALLLTGAFAGSLFYLAYTLEPFISAGWAFVATFAIHAAILAVCSFILPVEEGARPARTSSTATDQTAVASA